MMASSTKSLNLKLQMNSFLNFFFCPKLTKLFYLIPGSLKQKIVLFWFLIILKKCCKLYELWSFSTRFVPLTSLSLPLSHIYRESHSVLDSRHEVAARTRKSNHSLAPRKITSMSKWFIRDSFFLLTCCEMGFGIAERVGIKMGIPAFPFHLILFQILFH